MRFKFIGALVIGMLIHVIPAPASGQALVVMGGDHGKAAMVEADWDGAVLRGGVINRPGMDGHEWDWTAGAAWRFRGEMPVSMDLGFDIEKMAPGVDPDADIDLRGRIGAAFHVSKRAALFVERSRSLHNGTNYGRWMLGARVGF